MRRTRNGMSRGETARLAPALLAALALAALAVVPLAGSADDQVPLQITQCTQDPAAPADQQCDTSSATLAPEPAHRPKPKPRAATAVEVPVERHDVDLRHHVDRVHGRDGDKREQVKVDLADHRHAHRHHRRGHHAASGSPALPSVRTDGGSPFAGFGAGLDFVSGDEAVARFAIPPFLVPIYVAAARAYGVPWNVLAAINQIETDFGRVPDQRSRAGAIGWMQFMPGTWSDWGVDATGDGIADPYNPVDAIYAAARYLKASGAPDDIRRAVLAYNHADWYADSVLKTAGVYGSLPGGLVNETGSLAFGRFPVRGGVSYGDDFRRAKAAGAPARGLVIHGRPGAPAIATQDVTVVHVLVDARLARTLRRRSLRSRGLLRLAPVATATPDFSGALRSERPVPASLAARVRRSRTAAPRRAPRPRAGRLPAGFRLSRQSGVGVEVRDALGNHYRYAGLTRLRDGVRPGAVVHGGRVLGRLGGRSPAVLFSVRAAGGGAVDPRPLVDGYRLQEVADFYHAVAPLGGSPFVSDTPVAAGGVRGTQTELARKVLDDPGIHIYPGGVHDIESGAIDARVLGALLYLRRNGLELTISCLRNGHSFYTTSGNISAHSFGAAVDIGAFNGQPVLGHQGPGSLTEQAIKLLMQLDGTARPAQLISLMNLGGPSFAMADHADHLHVGYTFHPTLGLGRTGDELGRVTFDGHGLGGLSGHGDRADEQRLSGRLGGIANPQVPKKASHAGVAVESESPAAAGASRTTAPAPLRAVATAAGARLLDVDVPAGARDGEAYAIGTVSGLGRPGWVPHQVVVLAHHGAAWRIVGPPRTARGRVANPKLNALAAVAGGRGYAVGPRGRVVALRAGRPPLVLARVTRRSLSAVAARRTGATTHGVAVGTGGIAVELRGHRAGRRQAASPRASLAAVAYTARGLVATGRDGAGAPLVVQRRAGRWAPLGGKLKLRGGSTARLQTVASDGAALWVGGAVGGVGASTGSVPLLARLDGKGWRTFCPPAPALAAVRELGRATNAAACDVTVPLTGALPGGASDLAPTAHGLVLATAGGLQLFDGHTFRPLPAATSATFASVTRDGGRLALAPTGRGWALGADGRMTRVTAAAGTRSAATPGVTTHRSALTRGRLATVVALPGGDRALALGDRGAAMGSLSDWTPTSLPAAPLRDVAWTGAGDAWGVSDTGDLLRLQHGRWTAAGGSAAAIAFRSAREGYAVGAGGRIDRWDGRRWRRERSGVRDDLSAVAAGPRGVVAVGTGGTVLERTDGRWTPSADARAAAGERALTAAAVMPDGTLLAAGGDVVLVREPGASAWTPGAVAPLGLAVNKLAGTRAADGSLRVLALVGATGDRVVLVGDREGWGALGAPGLDRVADADLDAATGTLWVGGSADGAPAVARVTQPALAAAAPAPPVLDAATDSIRRLVG